MAYGGFKNLISKTAFNKVLRDKAFNIFKIQNMMDINIELLEWLVIF